MLTRFPAALGLAFCASTAMACPQYDTVVAAVQGGDQVGAEVLYDEIVFSAACDDAIREWVGDYLARESFLSALAATDADHKRALLIRALGFEKHWRSYAALGDIDWDQNNYTDAAKQYQIALNELSEGDPKHTAEVDEIAQLYERATAALALADQVVELPKTRSGSTGGIFTTSIRGFEIEEVNLPITFEYNSTQFDAQGETYALSLAEHLAFSGPPSINLGGHTDPIGGEEFNMDLSLARALAVETFLRENGFTGEIVVAGHGETMIPPAPAGIIPGSDEHHRIARRVSFSME